MECGGLCSSSDTCSAFLWMSDTGDCQRSPRVGLRTNTFDKVAAHVAVNEGGGTTFAFFAKKGNVNLLTSLKEPHANVLMLFYGVGTVILICPYNFNP